MNQIAISSKCFQHFLRVEQHVTIEQPVQKIDGQYFREAISDESKRFGDRVAAESKRTEKKVSRFLRKN